MKTQADQIKENEAEARVHIALGTLLRYFNYLDLNLGLCIRFLEDSPNLDMESLHSRLARMSTQKKIDRLQELVNSRTELAGAVQDNDFERWFTVAHEARSIRNFYIHGIWELLPLRKSKPLLFRLPSWIRTAFGEGIQKDMSIEELEESADEMKMVMEQFFRLRKKHGI